MSKSNFFEQDLLELIFRGDPFPNIADNAASSPATTLTIALHTADPGEDGNQSTGEATYAGYARVQVDRTGQAWTVSASVANPNEDIVFPVAGEGASETITHFSIGNGVNNYMLYYGTVEPNIVVTPGVSPFLTTATTITED